MAIVNGIITSPVPIPSEVNRVLGTAHTDLSHFCTDPNIKKWAQFKPLRYTAMGTTDQFNFTTGQWATNSSWWLGNFTGERWGMKFSIEGGIGNISTRTSDGKTYREPTSGFFYNLMRDNLRWTYVKPQGSGSSPYSPYRLTDFSFYNHAAKCPLPFSFTRTLYVSGTSGTMATYNMDCDIRSADDEVSYGLSLQFMTPPSGYTSVLPTLADAYVGVLFYNSTMDDCFWKCSKVRLSEMFGIDPAERAKALRVSFTEADFTNQYNKNHKDWKTRAFLCSKSLGYCETLVASQGHYLIACDEDAATCTLAVAGSMLITEFTASKIGTDVNVVVQITNNSGSSKTLTTPKVELITAGTSLVQDSYTWSNTTIANGATAVLNHKFTGILDTNLTARFTATYSGGSFNQSVHVVSK